MDHTRLERVFDVLEYVVLGPATVSEVSRDLHIPLSSAHDLLQAMVKTDLLELVSKRYRPGPRATRSSTALLRNIEVGQAAATPLRELAKATGCPGRIAFLVAGRVVRADAATVGPCSREAQTRHLSLEHTAAGLLFVAWDDSARREALSKRLADGNPRGVLDRALTRIRTAGHSVVREGCPGCAGVAAPVFDASGRLVCVVYVHATPMVVAACGRDGLVRAVRTAADQLRGRLEVRHSAEVRRPEAG
ncbi:IclR family transcriptional regulator C-terminal domain-containing protein [Gordonia sp. (in: high G+C Gram-positive bacteria)]|uniref:IclR family transcriptional regulator n=1 Tax=Gordonia sp. (in: high G+C Gram-positive bacteria) TaxID=84139 RepID=UPI003340F504